MENLIVVTLGDWSNDGHGKTSPYHFYSNKPIEIVREAYKIGVKILGVDLFDICKEYEEGSITEEVQNKFDCLKDFPNFDMNKDHFIKMFLEIVQKGNPGIILNEPKQIAFNGYWSKDDYFNGFLGYGLF